MKISKFQQKITRNPHKEKTPGNCEKKKSSQYKLTLSPDVGFSKQGLQGSYYKYIQGFIATI